MKDFNFGPACEGERMVFGAKRPGHPSETVSLAEVQEWLSFMKGEGVRRVCCLLPPLELLYYKDDLLHIYRREFGRDEVCWAPVEEYHLITVSLLKYQVLPFLEGSVVKGEPAVVHCSAGSGRTGQVLAAWLVSGHGFSADKALASVRDMGRNPYEAMDSGNASIADLYTLLNQCRRG